MLHIGPIHSAGGEHPLPSAADALHSPLDGGCVPPYTDVEERNIRSVLDSARAFNERDFDRSVENYADDMVWTLSTPPYKIIGKAGAKAAFEGVVKSVPGVYYLVESIFAAGNFVAVSYTVRADNGKKYWSSVLNEFDESGRRIAIHSVRTEHCVSTKAMEQRNVTSITNGVQAFNERNFEEAVSGISPAIVYYSTLFPQPIRGIQATVKALSELAKGIEVQFHPQAILANRNTVVVLLHGKTGDGLEISDLVLNVFDVEGKRILVKEHFDPFNKLPGSGISPPKKDSVPAPPPIDAATFPPGTDPRTYKLEAVKQQLDRDAAFTMAMAPDPARPGEKIMSADRWIGLKTHALLRWLDVKAGIAGDAGAAVGRACLTWRPIPDGLTVTGAFEVPPTPVEPDRPQRYVVEGEFDFNDKASSGVSVFGVGQSWLSPGQAAGRMTGVVADVTGGRGKLAGLAGNVLLNGVMNPTGSFDFDALLRVRDPSKRLVTASSLSAGRTMAGAAPKHISLVFAGSIDTKAGFVFDVTPDGKFTGAHGHERLGLMALRASVKDAKGLRVRMKRGPFVGAMRFDVFFPAFQPHAPLPFQTRQAVMTFVDRQGRELGTLRSDIVTGYAFPMAVAGAPLPAYRMEGLAPAQGGTGAFAQARGLVTVNSWLSIFPSFISSVVVLRLWDPQGRIAAAVRRAWS